MVWTRRFAPAKVNLFLHVGPVAPDGYHPVSSLMVFADVGDVVSLRDHHEMSFRLDGAFADILKLDPDNLVVRARDLLIARLARPPAPFEIVLEKRLPIAAGLGGGSADAAAALTLIRDRLAALGAVAPDDGAMLGLARALGADIAACLASSPVIATGRGDILSPAPILPPLPGVLVNPRAPSPTGAVYRAFDATATGQEGLDIPEPPSAFAGVESVAEWLGKSRNDLQAPAITLQPLIGEVLAILASAPEALFSRMSGSGATCFALCADTAAAARLAGRLGEARPDWWVEACSLS
jgi:4-diphosphocytidyl-2-C-methyl-D-erythritol kinase